ncbi:MAG: glycolate oxidase subunit GlcE, partial [Pseudomonadota bacterium]
LKPETAGQLQEAVEWAASEEKPLEVMGTGTKREVGRPSQHELTLDMSAFKGVTMYEPEELVLSARAATPRAEVEARLKEKGQEFAFEPPDLSGLLGSEDSGTLGGMISSNLGGPRRIKSGAVRDHFLGFSAVSGRGETFKSGGRVVKNVTGYDLPKILAGSWGTLAVMSDVTLKVLPAAETESTLILHGLGGESATQAMSAALQSSCEVSSAAFYPEGLKEKSQTALRLEGIGPSVDYRFQQLAGLLSSFGEAERLEEEKSRAFWTEVRDVTCFANGTQKPVWRISTTPSEGHRVAASLVSECEARCYLDWGGGLIWCEMPDENRVQPDKVRSFLRVPGGHATLIRASRLVRASTEVFHPPAAEIARLTTEIKDAFDPLGILNPGRMYAAN